MPFGRITTFTAQRSDCAQSSRRANHLTGAMNKFSSLSTTVLLALLTSSAAAQDYANGTTPQERSDAYVSSAPSKDKEVKGTSTDSDDEVSKLTQEGIDQLAQGANKLLDASSVKAQEWSQALSAAADDALQSGDHALKQAQSSAGDALSSLSDKVQAFSMALKGSDDRTATTPSGVVAQSSSQAVTAQHGALPLDNASAQSLNEQDEQVSAQGALAMVRTDYQLDLKQINPELTGTNLPGHLALSFEHPQALRESFMVAGHDVIIAYGNEEGNFQISLKLRPMDEAAYRALSMDALKSDLTRRFADKENMLYGEYQITQELSDFSQGAHQPYLDVSLLAFLKKGEDGILPDLQTHFYERNVVTRQYHATLSCELKGRQMQAPIVKERFELLQPMCERVLKSLNLTYSD